MDLTGTAAIISGGASGLGEATARALATAGSTVVIADLNADRGEAVAAELGGKFVQTDVADEASVTIAVDVAAALPSPLRVIVNCAGIGWAERTVNRDGSPHSYATFRKVIDINLIGTFNLMRIGAAAVARTEAVDADGQRVPLYRGDDRLRRRPVRDAAEAAPAGHRVLPGQEPLEVHPGAEGATGAGNDQRGDIAARVELVDVRRDAARYRLVDRVARLWAVDGDDANAVGHLGQNRFGH